MDQENSPATHASTIVMLCVFVLVCILAAGLWPFHAPRNAVSWLKDQNGLRFHRHGSGVTANAFPMTRASNDTGFSLEIWLAPERNSGGGTILAFDSSPDPRAPFILRQYGKGLALQRYFVDEHGGVQQLWFKVSHIFDAGKRVFVTITSDKSSTQIYVNGVLAETSRDQGITSRELTGRLVLGNSTVDDSWRGEITGLAVYGRELTAAQVSSNWNNWQSNQTESLMKESPIALYSFDERVGNIVHNRVDAATDMTLPDRYFVLHPAFLRSPQEQYRRTYSRWKSWGPWRDLGINVGGFIPVGIVFLAYFSSVKRVERPTLVVVLLGFLLSLTVECLQRLLPNRDSGMNDLITNTAGTALGTGLYQVSLVRTLWMKALDRSSSLFRPSNHSLETPSPTESKKRSVFA